MSRLHRRAGRATALAAFLAVTALAPAALACPVNQPGVAQSQQAYAKPVGVAAAVNPASVVGLRVFASTKNFQPQVAKFRTTLTRNPDTNNADAFLSTSEPCNPGSCSELQVKVPAGSDQTLYARAAWKSTTQYVHVWGISPAGKVYGASSIAGKLDKRVGNADVAPLAEFTVPDPAPGTWRIQVRAVFGVNIPVDAGVALVKAPALQLPQLDPTKLADKYLTQDVTYNIVMVNRHWSKDEIAAFRATMPTEYRSAVLEKQFDDGCDNSRDDASTRAVSDTGGTLINWGTSYYCGTDGSGSGNVPYFEPLKYRIHYRFLEAGTTWTRDLFAVMKKNTKYDQAFSPLPPVGGRRQTQGQYMAQYDAQDGKAARGTGHVVADPTKGDTIDAFNVEDWIFAHRYDHKYARSFRDLETGRLTSGAFITPDPGAYYDPFYTRTGRRDLDRTPQGPATSYAFFALDTFNGELAAQYFRPTAYHYFDVSNRMIDPDLHDASGPNFMRAWGGRYRFFLHDLGAGPNGYESADTALNQNYGGSASAPLGDPPIWDYDTQPQWSGLLAPRTARDAKIWLFSRFLGSYLYRPVPADSYLLADSNWQDCYSDPSCSAEGISYTDLPKIYDEPYVKKNLGAALPGATFNSLTGTKGFQSYRHLGCAANRGVASPDSSVVKISPLVADTLGVQGDTSQLPPLLVPDPECVGKPSDPLQEVLELAKARGDEIAGGINDVAANPAVMRAYVEAHRAQLAPQPAGQFTLTNISVVWPGATTWALPALVGGIAMGTPNGEGWGNLNNVNDRVKSEVATDCAKSKPVAPGCNGVPPISPGGGFSYTIEHESSHFLGLLHPHDFVVVDQDSKGKWSYYGTGFAKYGDFAMAPTTYAGAFAPYSVLDQDIIQKGHVGEYLRQTQDYLADAYLTDGMAGRSTPSAQTQRKVRESAHWRDLSSRLFRCGDFLHAEHAMRNAALAAQGVFGPVVAPRQLKPGEKVLFSVKAQPVFGADGQPMPGCASGTSRVPHFAATAYATPGGGGPTLPLSVPAPAVPALLVALLAVAGVGVARRRGLRLA